MTIRVRYAMLFCFLLFPFLVSELEAQTRIRREIENSPAAVEGPEHSRRPTRRPPDAPDWVPAPHIGSFSLDQSQLGVTVARGQSVSITIRVVPSGGFTDPVQITSPSGIGGGSVSIEPGIVNSPYDQVVTLTASTTEATTLGMQWVEIRGSGGGVVVDQGIYVDVVEPGAGTFEIYLSQEIVDVVQGSSGSLTVSTSKSGDFSAPIEYTISGLPEGLSVDALPHVAEPPVYAPFGVEFSAASSLAPGTYEAMITGTGGGQSASHPVSIRVTAPAAGDYTVAVTPNPVRFASHPARETFSFTIASVGGFAGAVEVSMVSNGEVVALAKDCAPGSFCPFVPTTFTLAAGGTAADQAIASTTGPVGGTIYLVTRTPGLDEKHTEVPVQPGLATPDFALAVTPAILTLPQGATSEVMLTLVRSGGFSDAVTVSASPSTGLQAPASLSFAPGETTKTVAITADMNAPAGAGHVLFNGTAPGVAGTRTARVDLMVTQTAQPDFTVALNPAAMTLTQGAAGTTVLNVQRTNGFAGPIDVMIAVPPGITADMTAFTIPAGETSRSVTLSAAPDAITGPQPVTFTAAAPEIGRTLTATLQLTVSQAAEPPDFTLAVTPAVMTLESGSAKTITLTLTRQNFAGAVHVAAVATPAGVNVPAVVFAPNETTQDVEITAPAGTAGGAGSITFSAVAPDLPGVARTATVALTVFSEPAPGAPVITAITPSGAVAGTQSLRLLLTGENFAFGARAETSDAALRIDSTNVQLESLAEVVVSIDPFASAGRYRINLTNPDGATTAEGIDFLVYEEGDIAAPLGVTSAAILSPLAGKTISPLVRPNAVGIVATSGTGTISGRWLLDGGTFDQFTITVAAGEPTIVTSRVPIPASWAGRHRLQLVIDVPQYTQSAAIDVTMAVESRTDLTILGPSANGGESTSSDEPLTLRWSMVPGALGYEVELEKNGRLFRRVAAGQEAELRLDWSDLASDPADETIPVSSFATAAPTEAQLEAVQRSAFRWRVAPVYCCSGSDFYPGSHSEWSPLRVGPGIVREGRADAAQYASAAADPVLDAWVRDAAIAAAVPRAWRIASDNSSAPVQSAPPPPAAQAPPSQPRLRKDWSVLPMLTTGYDFSDNAEQGTFQLSGQGDLGLPPLSSKYTTDFTGADLFGDNFTFAGSRNWIINVGNAARSTRAIRPEAIIGYAPPAFFQGAQLVTASLARGGALVRAVSRFGTASYYSSFTDALSGIMSGNFGMQQKIDAAAFELPAHKRYSFKVLALSVEDIPGASQYAPPGEGRSIGFLGAFNVSDKLQITAEGARGDAEWKTSNGLRERKGDALRIGLSGTFGRRMYRFDLSRTDADFVNPANRGFSTAALPNRTIGSLTLSTPIGRGSANLTLRHQLQTTSSVDADASGLNVSYNTPLGTRVMLSAVANYNVDNADANPVNHLPGADRQQLGTSLTFSERFGRLNLSQTLSHQQLRDAVNQNAESDTDTFTITGGGAVASNIQLYASTTVMRMSGFSDNDSVTVSLTPSFTIPGTYVSIAPQISYNYSKSSAYGSSSTNRGERYATLLQWNPSWLNRLAALQLSANWNRSHFENPFQESSSMGRSYVGTFTMKWGAGIGPATFRRTRAGDAAVSTSRAASQDPVNGRTPGRN